jgi:hypothetical protein
VSNVFIEIGQSTLRASFQDTVLEMPLERAGEGRLTADCRQQVAGSLREFIRKQGRFAHPRAVCAIGARGVSLRRVTLPSSARDNLPQLLALQIEKEFPLPPDALAWGWYSVEPQDSGKAGTNGSLEIVVAAMRREGIEEYTSLLREAGVEPVFTLGALAAGLACPPISGACALLDIDRQQSAFITFEDGVPTSVRNLPWGHELIKQTADGMPEASQHKTGQPAAHPSRDAIPDGAGHRQSRDPFASAIASLAQSINSVWSGRRIYLTGPDVPLDRLAAGLRVALGGGVECRPVELPAGNVRSAALLGLQKAARQDGHYPALLIEARKPADAPGHTPRAQPWKWGALAAGLVLCVGFLPYAEALLRKPALARRIADIESSRGNLPEIDRDLSFFQYLETNQSPYLNLLSIVGDAAPRGARINSLTLNRQGEFSMRGTMQNPGQLTQFRSNLIHSGWFSSVVVEEQTPEQNQQKVTLRMSARWKPGEPFTPPPVPEPGSPQMPGGLPPGFTTGFPPGGPPGMPPGMPQGLPPGVVISGRPMPPPGMPPGATPSVQPGTPPGLPPGESPEGPPDGPVMIIPQP